MAKKKVVMIAKTGGFTKEDFPEEIGADFSIVSCQTDAEIIAAAQDADAVICSALQPVTGAAISKLGKCRLIHSIGVGTDKIDVKAATENGICVSFAGDYCTEEVAEHTFTLILACARKIMRLDRAVREGKWDSIARDGIRKIWPPMFQVKGQTLGIVGFGRIARMIVPKAKGFEMRVVVSDPYVSPDVFKTMGVESVSFDKLLAESDFVSINAAMTPGNRHMFGAAQFKKMKPTTYFINCARAEFVDEKALIEALSNGTIAGAGLDIVEGERALPGNPILKLDNVIITAHSGYYSEQSSVMMRTRAYEMVDQVLKGDWPRMLVNPDVKEKYLKKWGKDSMK